MDQVQSTLEVSPEIGKGFVDRKKKIHKHNLCLHTVYYAFEAYTFPLWELYTSNCILQTQVGAKIGHSGLKQVIWV